MITGRGSYLMERRSLASKGLPLLCTFLVIMLLSAPVISTRAEGIPATLRHFGSGQVTHTVNLTQVYGGDDTNLTILLPKRSYVLGARMDLDGTAYEGANRVHSLNNTTDFENGVQTPPDNFVWDNEGFHLATDTISLFEEEIDIDAGTNVQAVVTGDFNGDGRDDLVAANYEADTVSVFYQNALGSLSSKTDLATSDQPRCLAMGDFNNDGRDDFAVGSYGGRRVEFFYQKAAGGFTKDTYSASITVQDIATGDFNSDNRDDVVLASNSKSAVTVIQSASGGFSTGQTLIVGETGSFYYSHDVRGVAVADFDSDGRDDVVFATCGRYTYNYDYSAYGKIKFYHQTASGILSYKSYIRGYTGCWNIAAGDVSDDGRPDIVIGQFYVNKVKVSYQTSSGGWSGLNNLGVSVGRPSNPVIVDADGDGLNDVLVGGQGNQWTMMSQVDGRIGITKKSMGTNHSIYDIAVGDLNNDGLVDLASANMDGDNVGVWYHRNTYAATWTSLPLVQPLTLTSINFTYRIDGTNGNTQVYFSLDNASWTEVENRTRYDLDNRPDNFWVRLTTCSTALDSYDAVRFIRMNMTYVSYPYQVSLDVGQDGRVDWKMSGELNDTIVAQGFERSITDYLKDPLNPPDAMGMVTVPITVHSDRPGTIRISNLVIVYNNASSRPVLVGPKANGFTTGTPTFTFSSRDSNGADLMYIVQITKTDFKDVFNTISFDMRYSLYDDVTGEGFSSDIYPEGTTASFTLPNLYGLEKERSYKWRVLAWDGHLLSEESIAQNLTVDSAIPVGQAHSPRYSPTLDFIVNWSTVDEMPGSGLSSSGTYDVQYMLSTDAEWTDWLIGTELAEATFPGEEAVTYHFRMRARDAVMNVGRYAEGEGDTTTTVDTLPPTLEAISPTPGQAVISGTVALKVVASDVGKVLVYGQVEYNLDDTGWSDLPLLPGDTTVWRHFLDTTKMLEGDHVVEFRATDLVGHVTLVSVAFVVDNTDPTCAVISPEVGDVATGSYTVRVEAGDNRGVRTVDLVFKGIPSIAEAAATYNDQSGYWELSVDTTLMGEGEVTMTARTIDTSGRRSPLIGPIAFDVDNLGPTILILEPLKDDFLTGDSSVVRVAISDMHLPEVKDNVDVSIDLGEWTRMAYSSGEYRFDWDIRTLPDGEHEIIVRARDDVGLETLGSIVARVDHNPPFLSVIDPQPEDILAGTVTLIVTVEEPFLDILQFNIDGGDWIDMEGMETTFDSSRYPDGLHNIVVRAVDLRDQETKQSLQVTFDNTPPQVVVSIPQPDEHVHGRIHFMLSCIDSSGIAKVLGSTEGTNHQLEINTTSGFFEWYLDTTDLADGEHTFLFIVPDTVQNQASESRTVHVDNSPPGVAELTVEARDGGIYRFVAAVTDPAGVDQVEVRIGDGSWIPMGRAGDGTYFHDWKTGIFDNEEGVRYRVRVSDTLGNTDEHEATMNVDNPIWGLVGIIALIVLALVGALYIYLRRRSLEEEAAVPSTHVDETVIFDPEEWVEEGAEEEISSPEDEWVAED